MGGFRQNLVVVAPDVGASKVARAYAKRFGASLALIDKRRPEANVAEVMNIIGDVAGCNCLLIDDICDTAGTLTSAAHALPRRERSTCTRSARTRSCRARHRAHRGAPISRMVVTDSVPLARDSDKIEVLSVAPLFAESIHRISADESVSTLFEGLFLMSARFRAFCVDPVHSNLIPYLLRCSLWHLAVTPRETGKKAVRRPAREGLVPCVIYRLALEPVHFAAEAPLAAPAHRRTTEQYRIEVALDGEAYDAVLEEVVFHPVTDRRCTSSSRRSTAGQTFTTTVPIVLKGTPEAVKDGADLAQPNLQIDSRAAEDLPGHIDLTCPDMVVATRCTSTTWSPEGRGADRSDPHHRDGLAAHARRGDRPVWTPRTPRSRNPGRRGHPNARSNAYRRRRGPGDPSR